MLFDDYRNYLCQSQNCIRIIKFFSILLMFTSFSSHAEVKFDHFPIAQEWIGIITGVGFSNYDETDSFLKSQQGGNDSCSWVSVSRRFTDHHPYNNSPQVKNEWRVRDLTCPTFFKNTLALYISNISCIPGYYLDDDSFTCLSGIDPSPECSKYQIQAPGCPDIAEPSKNTGQCNDANTPMPFAGTNPIHVGTGNKFQREIDYQSSVPNGLRFRRYYNSQIEGIGRIGKRWVADYWERLIIHISGESLSAHRADGRRNVYARSGSQWVGDPDVVETLEAIKNGSGDITHWKLTLANDTVEEYKDYGTFAALVSITDRNGLVTTINNELDIANGGDDSIHSPDIITGPFGRQLVFTYNPVNYELEKMTDPSGNEYHYMRDSNGSLNTVTYSDETPGDSNDNPSRIYHYEDTNFIHALTGITDENGNRFAIWTYDTQGRAISSEHADGVGQVNITYNADGSSTVTDGLGRNQTYHFEILHGVVKASQIDGGPCTTCGGQNQNTTYNANGFIASLTDFNGNQTTFINNSRGLETSRSEAVGTPHERTITTEWHLTFRLATKIIKPGKMTTFIYDTQGRLLERNEEATP